MASRDKPGVLAGYRVLDCSIAMAGPFAAQRLGDLGADVVKVEPVTGEWQRHAAAGGAGGNRINVSFLSLNRNKRSLAVDLKDPAGKEVLRRLVTTADVFLQNYRPGVADRLGVDYASLAAINPSLVYVSISGYGEDGPYARRPGQDLLVQAMSGAMLSSGRAGEAPRAAGQYLVDAVTASTAFEGVLAALLHRERTGEGQLVTVNMLDAVTTLQMQELSVHTVGGLPQTRSAQPHAHVYIRSPYGAFQTSDGYLVLAFPPLKRLGEILGEEAFLALRPRRPRPPAPRRGGGHRVPAAARRPVHPGGTGPLGRRLHRPHHAVVRHGRPSVGAAAGRRHPGRGHPDRPRR